MLQFTFAIKSVLVMRAFTFPFTVVYVLCSNITAPSIPTLHNSLSKKKNITSPTRKLALQLYFVYVVVIVMVWMNVHASVRFNQPCYVEKVYKGRLVKGIE